MQLTQYTDYALRTLIYLAATGKESTITEVAERFNISRNHLVKVVHNLGKTGFIRTERGKSGGISLARPANEIGIGDVVRKMETSFHIVECFRASGNQCPITPVCVLKNVLNEAFGNFMKTLDAYTLEDILGRRHAVLALLQPVEVGDAKSKKPQRNTGPAKKRSRTVA